MFKNFFFDSSPVLLNFFKNPFKIEHYSNEQWTLLVRTARESSLLAHLGWVIQQNAIEDFIPEKVKDHLNSAQTIVEYRKRTTVWELNRIRRVLLDSDIEIIVLKGSAYILLDLPFSYSRMFSDIDVLVRKKDIDNLEKTLISKNWQSVKIDEYDQHYYREWMHEIPPLRHSARSIEVDIHHTILPLTSRLQPNPQKLIEEAIDSDQYGYKVLSPCDMFLHSSTHLFYDSDLNNKLRDLIDLDQLAQFFSKNKIDFFDQLVDRALQLNLQRPLFYALRYSHKLLATPVTREALEASRAGAPSKILVLLMDVLVPRALLPEHPDHPKLIVSIARWLLYVRSHYLRMPLTLLLPHLFHKSKVRWEASASRNTI